MQTSVINIQALFSVCYTMFYDVKAVKAMVWFMHRTTYAQGGQVVLLLLALVLAYAIQGYGLVST